MWLRFKERLPLRISEIVESAIPVAAGNLRLGNPLGFDEMTEHFRVGDRGHRVGLALISLDQVAKDLQVILFFRSKVPTVQERIDHSDRFLQLLIRTDGTERKLDDQIQVTFSGIFPLVRSCHQQSSFHVPRS